MADKHKATYWELRALYNEQHSHDKANQAVPTITNAYIRAQNYLTGEVNQIYRRYFTDGDYTEAEAKQILNTTVSPTELVTLRALADNVSDKESKKQVNKYLSSMAAKGRITRLEELKAKSYIAAKQAASVELKTSTDLYTDVIQDAFNQLKDDGLIGSVGKDVELPRTGQSSSEGTNVHIVSNPKSGKEITRVNAVPDTPITEFKELSGKYVKAALDTPWYGRNFSQRIWHNTDKLAERVNELFTAQQMSGMRERDMAKALADEFGASMARAKTLIRTEANYFHNKTNLDSWKQRGVKQYKLVAVLDMRTSKFCRNIDGKVLDVEQAVMGLTFPPFHPNCRTIAVIYLPGSKYKLPRNAFNPNTGKMFKLDSDATYHDWERAIVKIDGEMGRNGEKFVSSNPMPVDEFQQVTKWFTDRGGVIQMDKDTERHLDAFGNEASKFGTHTILFHRHPGRAAVYEELYHVRQLLGRGIEEYTNNGDMYRDEIETQHYLLDQANELKLNEDEQVQTREALEYWEAKLHDYNDSQS